ncbi:MAG: Holliday junction ATP-dependent DNA helicase RuvA [Ignavibacteriae bacterium]|nr:Holliday junction ATP-dependent DNA helicase RuvA [Ignavibacteriota bacterium]
MISYLNGILKHRHRNEIVLDVNGVGYSVFVSKRILENIPEVNKEFSLITYLDVKENALNLYGFYDEKEKEIFKMLISVSGISAKTANTILYYATFEEIIGLINNKTSFSAVKIPGIGPKKIEMISLALRDKIFKISDDVQSDSMRRIENLSGNDQSRFDALNALLNLGYQRSDAEKIIREVLKENSDLALTTEDIIKKSLNYISK